MKFKIILFLVLFLNSCSSSYKIAVEETVTILDYDIFVFRLCEKTNKLGNERFYLCDVDCKTTTKALEEDYTQVIEELYLLVSRSTEDIIYLTTKMNRSFDKSPDIFNTEAHEDYVLVNDLENIYFGKKTESTLLFTNRNETLTLYKKGDTKSCKIAITSILSNSKESNEINNTEIAINTIYNMPFEFNLTNRILAIKVKNSSNYEGVQTIELTKTKLRFNGVLNYIESSKRRRLKFHPEF